ncbi:hypothetical protein NPX13_g1068 [Xylaria arbuscula]|uniref:Uncharacterized protein n=1 Tax=Xylaria arbuscula TaxID=114810 RepID=A0A9W8TPZ2_9PEZI|nr:hypothetical protein NPX13_g1068 [Xylaria arbuscula]
MELRSPPLRDGQDLARPDHGELLLRAASPRAKEILGAALRLDQPRCRTLKHDWYGSNKSKPSHAEHDAHSHRADPRPQPAVRTQQRDRHDKGDAPDAPPRRRLRAKYWAP